MNSSQLLKFTLAKMNFRFTWRFMISFATVLFLLIFLSYAVRFTTNPNANPATFRLDAISNFRIYMASMHFITIVLLCVFIIVSVLRDFDFNIEKKHLVDGMSQADCYSSKLIQMLFAGLFATVLVSLFIVLEGILFRGLTLQAFADNRLVSLLMYFMITTIYFPAIALALAHIIRSTAFVLLTLLLLLIAEQGIIHYAVVMNLTKLVPYLPLSALSVAHDELSFPSVAYAFIVLNLALITGFIAQKNNYAK